MENNVTGSFFNVRQMFWGLIYYLVVSGCWYNFVYFQTVVMGKDVVVNPAQRGR